MTTNPFLRPSVLLACLATVSTLSAQAPRPVVVPEEERTAEAPTPVAPPKAEPAPEIGEGQKTAPTKSAPARRLPGNPEDDLRDYCEMLFSKASYGLALQQYGQYLLNYPQGKYREEVRFKMGECHYKLESWDLAIQEFDQYVKDHSGGKNRGIVHYHLGESHFKSALRMPEELREERMQLAYDAYRAGIQSDRSGPYAAYSAFRLGTFIYNAASLKRESARFKESARWFAIAAAQAPREQLKLKTTAQFFLGRSQRQIGALKDATNTFTELTKVRQDNEYYEKAWLELAQMDMEAGRPEEAQKKFEQVARETEQEELKAESLVNAGMIDADAGRSAEAMQKFEQVLGLPADRAKNARARARFGMVFSSFKQKEWDKVIMAWTGLQSTDYAGFDEYTRARLWLIVGTAYAATDKHVVAAQTLKLLESLQISPNKQVIEACLEGGYKRLVSLFKSNDQQVPEDVDEFKRAWDDRMSESDYLDKALLIKGAFFFNKSVWSSAAKAYKGVRTAKLEPGKIATLLYQKGCAEAACGDKEATATLSDFLAKNPTDERAAMAQLQRGLSRLKQEDVANALNDFIEVASRAAGTQIGETATYQAARVRGMRQDFAGMVEGFDRLLKEYPSTKAVAESQYWIGVGNYKLGKYKECLEPLKTARTMDAKSYVEETSLMIIGALVAEPEKDLDAIVKEVDLFINAKTEKKLGADILTWLGMTLFKEKKDYTRTSKYLGLVAEFNKPTNTPLEVWQTYGEAMIEIGNFESSVAALDIHIKQDEKPLAKARSWLLKGRALYALNKLELASKSVDEGLTIDKETLLAAQLNLLSGDIDAKRGNVNSAISSYNLVRTTWEDPQITPSAMARQAALLKKSGQPTQIKEGEAMEQELKRLFPRYKPDGF